MPRSWVKEGPDIASFCVLENMAVDFYGTAYLISTNGMPNPDLTDFTNTGKPAYWTMDAPDRPDGWYVYLRQLTRIKAGGDVVRLKQKLRKQTYGKISLKRNFYDLEGDPIAGGSLTDPQKRAPIAPPQEIRVKVITEKGKQQGFKDGDWYVAPFLIMGADPINSSRITATAPPVKLALLQGQKIAVEGLDAYAGEGVTGVGLAVGRDRENMYDSRRVDMRYGAPERVVIGREVKSGRKVNMATPNSTTTSGNTGGGVPGKKNEEDNGIREESDFSGQRELMNNGASRAQELINQIRDQGRPVLGSEPLATRIGPSGSALQEGSVEVSFRYVTDDGIGEMLSPVTFTFEETTPGSCFGFRPEDFPDEATGYIAMVFGDDDGWYRLLNPDSGGVIYAPDEWAEIVSNHVPVDGDEFYDDDSEDEPRPTQPMVLDDSATLGEIADRLLYEDLPLEAEAPVENTTDPVSTSSVDSDDFWTLDEDQLWRLDDESVSQDAGNFVEERRASDEPLHDAWGKDEDSVFSQAGVPYAGWIVDTEENLLIQRINSRREDMGYAPLVISRDLNLHAYERAGGLRESNDPEDVSGRTFTDEFETDADSFEEAYSRLASHFMYREGMTRIGIAREANTAGPGFVWVLMYSDGDLPPVVKAKDASCMLYEPDGTGHEYRQDGAHIASFTVTGEILEDDGARAESFHMESVHADAATELPNPAVSGDRMDFSYSGSYSQSLENAGRSLDGLAFGIQRVSSGAMVAISDGDLPGTVLGSTRYAGPGNTTIVGDSGGLARNSGFRNQGMWCHELLHAAGEAHAPSGTRSMMVPILAYDWNTAQSPYDTDRMKAWWGAGGPSGSGSGDSGSGSSGGSFGGSSSDDGDSGESTPEQEGLANPTTPLELVYAIGVERMKPGDYELATTNACKGQESAPGPLKKVRLRDMGIASGGAASGVTDQYIRVFAPAAQRITNPEMSEKDRDGLDLEWEIPSLPTGLTVGTADGILKINDRTNASTEVPIRLGEMVEINAARLHTFKMELAVGDQWTGGRLSAHASFYNASGTLLTTVLLGKTRKKVGQKIKKVGGPRNVRGRSEKCDFFIPAASRFCRIFWKVASQYGARNAYYEVSNIGLLAGLGAGRKRYNLGLGLTNDRDDRDRRAKGEDKDKPYPSGPYCRVVKDPDDPAYHMAPDYLERLEFEGLSQTSQVPSPFSVVASTGVDARIRQGVKVYSEKSAALLLEKASGNSTQTNAYVRVAPTYLASRAAFAYRFCIKLQDIWSSGTPRLMRINRVGGGQGIELYHTANDQLRLIVPNGGSTATLDVEEDIDQGDRLKIEVLVKNVGTGGGSAEVHIWKNERRAPVVKLQSLNWSGVTFQHADCGVMSLTSSETFTAIVDRVALTKEGDLDAEYVPGNYFEYWAPEGTPLGDYFVKGMKHPLKPNTDYVVSCYVGSENVDRPANLLNLAVKGYSGAVQQGLGPMVKQLDGDMLWKRVHIAFRTRNDGKRKYLEFTGNRVGGGLIRAMGFQIDEGRTAAEGPRKFTNENVAAGSITFPIAITLPGGDTVSNSIQGDTQFLRAGCVAERPSGTATDVDLASAQTKALATNAPFYPNASQMLAANGDRNLYYKVKVNCTTDDLTKSPLVRGAFVDFMRGMPQLLKADGSEYRSGVLVHNLPPVEARRMIVVQTYADGSEGFEDLTVGPVPRFLTGFDLECFRDSTATQVTFDRGKDSGVFVIEARGKRYRVRFFGGVFAANRSQFKRYDAGKDAGWHHRASGIEARVLSVEPL